jgi:TolB-like protein/Flp pilus assembly protein TadD/DNA-binding winged helix-turn-helix (wHTH) protein
MSAQPLRGDVSRPRLRVGAYSVDPETGTIEPAAGGRARHVPPHAIATLLCLAEQRGKVVPRDVILERWPDGVERTVETLTHVIHQLREAFADDARHSRYIRTVKNRGYQLVARLEGDWNRSADGQTRTLLRVAVLYWGAAWVVLQAAELIFDLGRQDTRNMVGAAILAFPLVLGLAWWFQRNFDLPRVFEALLGLIPKSDAALIAAAIVVAALLFIAFQSLTREDRTPPPPPPEAEKRIDLSEAAKNSVAVLPFVFEGTEPAYAYLADGLPDELIAVLSRLTEIQVVSRTASDYYKGKNVDLQTIAQKLQVAHIVEGRVGMEGERLRVTVKLVDAGSGRAVWSHVYTQRLGSVFALYDIIVARLAQELALEISPDLHASLAPMRPANEEAYSLYLRGREMLQRPKEGGVLQQARDLFQAALAQDPGFARAYAGLCDTYLAQYRATRDSALIEPATTACDRALELDPGASEVQVAIAKLRIETGDYEAADVALEAALKRNPRLYEAYIRLGDLRWRQQRPDEAVKAYQTAIQLQPGNWQAYSSYGIFLISVRADYAGAETQFEKVLSLTPESTIALANLGAAYMFEGRLEDAAVTYEKLLALEPNGQTLSNLGLTYYYLGRYEDAVRTLEQASEAAPNDHRVWGNLALAQSFADPAPVRARASYTKAITLGEQRLAVDAADADALADIAAYNAAVGNASAARQQIGQAVELSPTDGAILYLAAVVDTLLGDPKSALDTLRSSLAAGYPRRFIEGDARLRELTQSDEYKSLVLETDRE